MVRIDCHLTSNFDVLRDEIGEWNPMLEQVFVSFVWEQRLGVICSALRQIVLAKIHFYPYEKLEIFNIVDIKATIRHLKRLKSMNSF